MRLIQDAANRQENDKREVVSVKVCNSLESTPHGPTNKRSVLSHLAVSSAGSRQKEDDSFVQDACRSKRVKLENDIPSQLSNDSIPRSTEVCQAPDQVRFVSAHAIANTFIYRLG